MRRYRVELPNGQLFFVKALMSKENEGVYTLWYRTNRYWGKWQFGGLADQANMIEPALNILFGFRAIVHRVKLYYKD